MIDYVIRHLEAFLQNTGNQQGPAPCECARATAKGPGTYTAMHKYYHNNFSANKQNHEQGGSAV
jgi:hypothetical protein